MTLTLWVNSADSLMQDVEVYHIMEYPRVLSLNLRHAYGQMKLFIYAATIDYEQRSLLLYMRQGPWGSLAEEGWIQRRNFRKVSSSSTGNCTG